MNRRRGRGMLWGPGLLGAMLAAITLALTVGGAATPARGPVEPPLILALPVPAATHGPPDAARAATASALALVIGQTGPVTWQPSIIFNDGVEDAFFAIAITGGDFDAVYLTTEGALQPDPDLPAAVLQLESELIRLYDDGSHGDLVAADGVFSRGGITAVGPLTHDAGTHQRLNNRLFFFEQKPGQVSWGTLTMESGIGVVDRSQRGAAPVVTLGPNLTATSHALFLVDDGSLFPNYPAVDADTAVRVCQLCEILIDRFGDVFDFVVVQTREIVNEPQRNIRTAFMTITRNAVIGIGLDESDLNIGPNVFDTGEPFNTFSAGRLQGIIFSNRVDGSALSHEVMHRWVAHAAEPLGWLDGVGHFVAASTINGLMDLQLVSDGGGAVEHPDAPGLPADLEPNADGTFRIVPRPGPFRPTFAPISLYLAGFIPPAQVPAMFLVGGLDLSDPERIT